MVDLFTMEFITFITDLKLNLNKLKFIVDLKWPKSF